MRSLLVSFSLVGFATTGLQPSVRAAQAPGTPRLVIMLVIDQLSVACTDDTEAPHIGYRKEAPLASTAAAAAGIATGTALRPAFQATTDRHVSPARLLMSSQIRRPGAPVATGSLLEKNLMLPWGTRTDKVCVDSVTGLRLPDVEWRVLREVLR